MNPLNQNGCKSFDDTIILRKVRKEKKNERAVPVTYIEWEANPSMLSAQCYANITTKLQRGLGHGYVEYGWVVGMYE